MEQPSSSQRGADLLGVAAAVEEAKKQRLLVEQQLQAARAAVDALKNQGQSLDQSVSELQRQLDAARSSEDAALAEMADQKRQVLSAHLNLAHTSAAEIAAEAGDLNATVAELRSRIAALRKKADALERQLSEIETSADAASAEASGLAQRAAAALKELDSAAAVTLRGCGESSPVDAGRVSGVPHAQPQSRTHASAAPPIAVRPGARLSGEPPRRDLTVAPGRRPQGPHTSSFALDAVAMLEADGAVSHEDAARMSTMLREHRRGDALNLARVRAATSESAAAYGVIIGAMLRDSGDARSATEAYERAATSRGIDAHLRYRIFQALYDLGAPEAADDVALQLRRDERGKLLWLNAESARLRRLGKVEEAERVLAGGLLESGFPDWHYLETLYNLGDLHECSEEPNSLELALLSYEELAAGDPGYRDVTARIDRVRRKLLRWEVSGATQ